MIQSHNKLLLWLWQKQHRIKLLFRQKGDACRFRTWWERYSGFIEINLHLSLLGVIVCLEPFSHLLQALQTSYYYKMFFCFLDFHWNCMGLWLSLLGRSERHHFGWQFTYLRRRLRKGNSPGRQQWPGSPLHGLHLQGSEFSLPPPPSSFSLQFEKFRLYWAWKVTHCSIRGIV